MKQILILSGKGGSGKTSVSASLAHLAHQDTLRTVLADADVDAANLELLLSPTILEEHEFIGGKTASINPELCIGCGICQSVCRFDAVLENNDLYSIDPVACDGCASCMHQCPVDAITLEAQKAGTWFRSECRFGPLFHAALLPAQDNSGKLVALVKQQARQLAELEEYPLMIADGPPGIGCPVIAAMSGVDLALIIAEPSLAGVHDMQRAVEITQHFRIPVVVCINKADIYLEGSELIAAYCQEQGIDLVGKIPFDSQVTEAMVNGQPITVYMPDAPAAVELAKLWAALKSRIFM